MIYSASFDTSNVPIAELSHTFKRWLDNALQVASVFFTIGNTHELFMTPEAYTRLLHLGMICDGKCCSIPVVSSVFQHKDFRDYRELSEGVVQYTLKET